MCTEDHKWHYDYVRLAWDAGFSFDKYKYPNLDKNKICLINIDRVIKERDIASIERFLPTVVQYVLENDQAELLDSNFVKMFRVSQLSVEYLLFCKKYLDNTVVLLKRELSKLKEENKELKLFTEELEMHISTLTKHNYGTTFKCDKCLKVFSTEEYLNSHKKRRHNSENKTSSSSPETNQLESEIKQLKERLNIAEKLLQEKEEKTENIKLDTNENENKLRVDEVLEKFEKFKDKVENDIKILQIEKNFYEEKYGKLFDVVLESNRKESVESVQSAQNQEQTQEKCATDVDRIETTTQTEQEKAPVRELQIETVHNKNVFEFKELETEADATNNRNIIQETIEQKIDQFEEQLELKISSGLSNIEKQMQAFWGKLSEIESKQEIKIKDEGDTISYRQQEPIRVDTAKPMIKPRMKLSKPSKYTNVGEENARKIQAEIEKMSMKPTINTVTVEAVPEKKLDRISSVLYDSSSSPDTEKKSDSDSDSSVTETIPHKIQEVKPSMFTLGKRSITSLKNASQSKEVTDKLREELNNVVNNRLQDIGISPNWKGIPQKTFEKALEIVRHQAGLVKKSYPNFDSLRKSIEKSLNSNKEIVQKSKSRSNFDSTSKQTNVISIKYRRKPKKAEPEPEAKPVVTIKNRLLYNTDSDSENIQPPISPVKSPMRVVEVVPSYSAVIKELKQSQNKNVDTDSEINSIILPKEEITKSVLKSYPSMGSLTKKKVLFDIESDRIEVDDLIEDKVNSLSSIDSSDVLKVVDEVKKLKKTESSLSDFDLSEL